MAASKAENEKLRNADKDKTKKLQSTRKSLADSEDKVKKLKKQNLQFKELEKKMLKQNQAMDKQVRNQTAQFEDIKKTIGVLKLELIELREIKSKHKEQCKEIKTTKKLLHDSQNENQELRLQVSQLKTKLAESEVAQNAMLRLAQAMNISQTQESSTPPARKRIKIENTST